MPQCGTSTEYSQHMVLYRNKKKFQHVLVKKKKKTLSGAMHCKLPQIISKIITLPRAVNTHLSADDLLKYFSPQTDFDILCKVETICMKSGFMNMREMSGIFFFFLLKVRGIL